MSKVEQRYEKHETLEGFYMIAIFTYFLNLLTSVINDSKTLLEDLSPYMVKSKFHEEFLSLSKVIRKGFRGYPYQRL